MISIYPPHSSLTPGSKVIAYLRDSGGDHQEDSIDRQEVEVRRWCKQYQLILTGIYTDEARTARHSLHKRKDLLSMMAYLRGGADEKGVIIWNYERFSRNIKHGRHFLAEIEALDKVVCSLTDNIPEGPERYFIQDLKLWSAEQTSVKISIDVTSGLRRMVQEYRGVPGVPPKGFQRSAPIVIGKHRDGLPRIVHAWEPDPSLAPTIRFAFEMRARGATLKQIMDATHLFPSINSYTTFFINRLYMGILEYGDLTIKDYCDPIVPVELWNKVQEVGSARARISKDNNPRRLASTFILSGLVFCQHCGSPLNGHVIAKKDRPIREYYICSRKARRRDCPAREIPARQLEGAILQHLENLIHDTEFLLHFQPGVIEHYQRMDDRLDGEQKRLSRELSISEKRVTHLAEAIADRGHSDTLLDSLEKAEARAKELRVELASLRSENPIQVEYTLDDIAFEIKEVLHGDNLQQKKQAIHMLATRILAARNDREVNAVLYHMPAACLGDGVEDPKAEPKISPRRKRR